MLSCRLTESSARLHALAGMHAQILTSSDIDCLQMFSYALCCYTHQRHCRRRDWAQKIERETVAVTLPHRATADQSAWLNSRPLHSVTFATTGRGSYLDYQLLELTAAAFATSPDMLAASTQTLEVEPATLTPPGHKYAQTSAFVRIRSGLELDLMMNPLANWCFAVELSLPVQND